MNNITHTPGPWRFKAAHDSTSSINIKSGNIEIGTIWMYDNGKKVIDPFEAEANARLMAAAPDLLSVLKEAVDHSHVYNTPPVLVELFTAAINAATGVSIEQSIS